MGTGMLLGGRDETPLPPPPVPGPWGGKGEEGEGAPTFGGLAGTAGLGLTSGGTMSDMYFILELLSFRPHFASFLQFFSCVCFSL